MSISPALQVYADANTGSATTTSVTVTGSTPGVLGDITINTTQSNTITYSASNSITLDPGFITDDNIEFSSPAGGSVNDNISVSNNPIPTGINLIPLTLTFYDNSKLEIVPVISPYNE